MKYLRLLIVLNLTVFIFSCANVQDGFVKKKNNSDEFLVEKKSPLIMPPEFNKLPVPNSKNKKIKKNEETIESLISNSETQTGNNRNNTDQNLEKTILDKIKE